MLKLWSLEWLVDFRKYLLKLMLELFGIKYRRKIQTDTRFNVNLSSTLIWTTMMMFELAVRGKTCVWNVGNCWLWQSRLSKRLYSKILDFGSWCLYFLEEEDSIYGFVIRMQENWRILWGRQSWTICSWWRVTRKRLLCCRKRLLSRSLLICCGKENCSMDLVNKLSNIYWNSVPVHMFSAVC
jgi:hypothetical protein